MRSERIHNAIEKARDWVRPLVFLPNVTPFKQLFSSEIFPWAFVYSLRKNMSLPLGYILFLAYMVLSAIYIYSTGVGFMVPVRAFFALLNATLIFFVIIGSEDLEYEKIKKVFLWVFAINVIISIVQYLAVFPGFLTPFMRLFIDRFTDQPHGAGRGVAALFAEPSYASFAIHYFFAFAMFHYKVEAKSVLGYMALLGLIIFDVFIIRSITGLVMVAVYFLSLQRWKYLWRGAILFVVLGLVVIYLSKKFGETPRALEFMYDLIYNQEYKDPMPFLLNESGFRIISVWASYTYGFTHPLGSGIGGWVIASLQSMDDIGVPATEIGFFAEFSGGEFDGVRPTSFVADLFLEMGWVGFVVFILAFYRFMFSKNLFSHVQSRPIAVLFLFNLFVVGTIGDPLPFVFLAMVYRGMMPHETEKALAA